VLRRASEYVRHGTCTGILSWNVVTGRIPAPTLGLRRIEVDFLGNVQGKVAMDPGVRQWYFVLNSLNIHRSGALVGWVAAEADLVMPPGE